MNRRRALALLGGSAAGLGLAGALPAAACDSFPRGAGWRFLVLRHESPIGTHVFRFSRRGRDLVVDITVDVAVELLDITLYRFTHRAEEVWRDGRLQVLVSATDDDDTLWRVQAERRGDTLRGRANDVAFEIPGFVIPASLWHPDTVTAPALLDTIEGRMRAITGQTLGEEVVNVAGVERSARHVRLTGQLERDIWYDADCAIARVAFPARDGSLITLERQ